MDRITTGLVIGFLVFLSVLAIRNLITVWHQDNQASATCKPMMRVTMYESDAKHFVVCYTLDGGTEVKQYK